MHNSTSQWNTIFCVSWSQSR